MDQLHWNQFIALESDFEDCLRYVEPHENNMHAFSTQFSILLLSACSEVDVVLREIYKLAIPKNKQKRTTNINDHYDAILALKAEDRDCMTDLENICVGIERNTLLIEPWTRWGHGYPPSWWTAYNKVKHERSDYFDQANLVNVLFSMAGLLSALAVYYRLAGSNTLIPAPSYFSLPPSVAFPAVFHDGVTGVRVGEKSVNGAVVGHEAMNSFLGVGQQNFESIMLSLVDERQRMLGPDGTIASKFDYYAAMGWSSTCSHT